MADNYIDKDGLHTQTVTQIRESLVTEYQNIYGDDITVDSDTPDGQRIGIEAQAKADVLDYSKQVYNCFDVDTVIGDAQDRLYKINNVYRRNADYTFVVVNVTVDRPVTLQGLDANVNNPNGTGYIVSDEIGTNFILVNSVTLTNAGTYSLDFRAEKLGAVDVSPNTLTKMVTVIAGVTNVVNLAKQYITGNTQETDAQFRIRRNRSTAISGQGFFDSLEGQLLSIPNVTAAVVYENTPDEKNIPQSLLDSAIWCIVEGGLDGDIAKVIYANRTMGCAMVGGTTATIDRPDGTTFTARFDRPQAEALYLDITVKSRVGVTPDTDYIKSELVNRLKFEIYQKVTSTDIIVCIAGIDSTVYVTDCTLSTDGETYSEEVTPATKDRYFTLSESNIDITGEI
ncbi:MAG: hypothetical protein UE295_00470 [Acutalibacteraceae bacterium]|nr:hypothetical protein [Acutalibacteraceae bacterium]